MHLCGRQTADTDQMWQCLSAYARLLLVQVGGWRRWLAALLREVAAWWLGA